MFMTGLFGVMRTHQRDPPSQLTTHVIGLPACRLEPGPGVMHIISKERRRRRIRRRIVAEVRELFALVTTSSQTPALDQPPAYRVRIAIARNPESGPRTLRWHSANRSCLPAETRDRCELPPVPCRVARDAVCSLGPAHPAAQERAACV